MCVASVSFQDGVSPSESYAGTTDTVLRENEPTATGGSSVELQVDFDFPSATRKSVVTLLRFDLSAIPPDSTIFGVMLTLNVTNPTSGATGHSLYALSRPWVEDQANWSLAATDSAWAAAGARGASDRIDTALATLNPAVNGATTVALNAAGVAAVQAWVTNPAVNFGFVFDSAKNADGLTADSSEATTPTHRPKLTLAY